MYYVSKWQVQTNKKKTDTIKIFCFIGILGCNYGKKVSTLPSRTFYYASEQNSWGKMKETQLEVLNSDISNMEMK